MTGQLHHAPGHDPATRPLGSNTVLVSVAADATKSDCAKLWKAALGFALALASSDCAAAGIRVLGALLYVAPRCLEGSRFRPSVRASC